MRNKRQKEARESGGKKRGGAEMAEKGESQVRLQGERENSNKILILATNYNLFQLYIMMS